MTKQKSFKRHVRERMSKTGERYAAARGQVERKRERVRTATARLADTADRPTDDTIEQATGTTWKAWFSILDRWGAQERTHRETAAFLKEEHDVPGWWAQTITVWYQRARGMRLKHQQSDGFSISASKTIAVPVDVAFEAFVNPRTRRKWLDGSMRLRTSRPDISARFDWGDGSTRLIVSFEEKGPSKSVVAIAHERLPDADEAETTKLRWRQRLSELKSFLES